MDRNTILIKIKELTRLYDLGFVLNNMEDLIFLIPPCKTSNISNEQYNNNKNLSKMLIDRSETTLKKLISEYNIRKSTYDKIRTIYPDFAQNISLSLTEEEYKEYLDLIRKCNKDLTTLVFSFYDRNNDYENLLLTKKDSVSEIVDNFDNSRISFIQDQYVLTELDKIDISTLDDDTRKNVSHIQKQLLYRITKYQESQKIYNTKNKFVFKKEER